MNWQDIKVSEDSSYFLLNGKPVFKKRFMEVLKFHAPGLAPVIDETGAYHIKADGHQLYDERYTRTFGFYCHRASVLAGTKCFHITETGERAYTGFFAWCGNYQQELCTVRDKYGGYFHIDMQGLRAYAEDYLYAGDYKDGYACVMDNHGLFFHIDLYGKPLYEVRFKDLGVFHKNFATAKDDLGWFHINKQGEAIYLERYLMLEPFYNGYALATLSNLEKIVIDENGTISVRIKP